MFRKILSILSSCWVGIFLFVFYLVPAEETNAANKQWIIEKGRYILFDPSRLQGDVGRCDGALDVSSAQNIEKIRVTITPDEGVSKTHEVVKPVPKANKTKSNIEIYSSYDLEKLDRAQEIVDMVRDPANAFLLGKVKYELLGKLLRKYTTVALVLGNRERSLSPEELKIVSQIISKLIKDKVVILYDADAASADQIKPLLGTTSIGITGAPRAGSGQVSIVNPYDRLKLFNHSSEIITTPGSVLGLAALMSSSERTYVIDPQNSFLPAYDQWRKSNLIRDFNFDVFLKYVRLIKSISDYSVPYSLKENWDARAVDKIERFDAVKLIDTYEKGTLKNFIEENEAVREAAARLAQLPEGAVFFGSGHYVERYASLIQETMAEVAQRGIPVFTGGSGGLMAVANRVAYEIGVDSVGIPMGSKHRLISEKRDASEYHTETIPATNYSSRIPLLLKDRPMVVVAPGGKGTFRELATFLSLINAESTESERHLVFIDPEFYKSLVSLLRTEVFPESFRQRVHIVEKPTEVADVVEKIEASLGEKAVGVLISSKPLMPRLLERRNDADTLNSSNLLLPRLTESQVSNEPPRRRFREGDLGFYLGKLVKVTTSIFTDGYGVLPELGSPKFVKENQLRTPEEYGFKEGRKIVNRNPRSRYYGSKGVLLSISVLNGQKFYRFKYLEHDFSVDITELDFLETFKPESPNSRKSKTRKQKVRDSQIDLTDPDTDISGWENEGGHS